MASKKESTFLSMTITLLMVTVAAALALGGVYSMTKEKIEMAKKAKLEAAIQKVVPAFDELKSYKVKPEGKADSLGFYEAIKDGTVVGTAIETYTDDGFSGRIRIMVGFKPDGTIINTAVLEHKETPGLGDKMEASKSDFPNQFEGKNPEKFDLRVKKDGGDVDAITASTITSRAFCDATERAYKALKKQGGKQ